MGLLSTATRVLAVTALGAGAIIAAGSSASAADAPKYFTTHVNSTCNTSTGQWDVDWSIENQSDESAEVSEVQSTPVSSPISTVPSTVAANSTVHATQSVPSTGIIATLRYTARWADGTTTVNAWQFRPVTLCTATTPKWSGPVLDAAGAHRGSINADSALVTACDWLADGVQVSVEYRFADGHSDRRIAPLGGCTAAQASGSPIVAVRGFADDFANGWHSLA